MGVIWPAGSGKAFVVAAAFGVLIALGSSPAQAMQLSPQQKAEMKLHYDKATRAYDVGKYQEAIEEYQKAYEIGGDAAMIYNIAQLQISENHYDQGLKTMDQYMAESCNPLPDAHILFASVLAERKSWADALRQVDLALAKAKAPKESWLLLKLARGLTTYRRHAVQAIALYWHAVNLLTLIVTLTLLSAAVG